MAIDLSVGFKILGQEPIDTRQVVASRTAVNSHEAYIGLVVYDSTDNKIYVLKAADPSVEANWEEVGAGGGSGSNVPDSPAAIATSTDYVLKVPETGSSDVVSWTEAPAGIDIPNAPSAQATDQQYELLVPNTGSTDPLSWAVKADDGIPGAPPNDTVAKRYELLVPITGDASWTEPESDGIPDAPAAGANDVSYTLTIPATDSTDAVAWTNPLNTANLWNAAQEFENNSYVTFGTDDPTDATMSSKLVLSTVRQEAASKQGLTGAIDFTTGHGPNRGSGNIWSDNILSTIQSDAETIGALANERGNVTIKNRPESSTEEGKLALVDSAKFSTQQQTFGEKVSVSNTASASGHANVIEIYKNLSDLGIGAEVLGGGIEWYSNFASSSNKMTSPYVAIQAVLDKTPENFESSYAGTLEIVHGEKGMRLSSFGKDDIRLAASVLVDKTVSIPGDFALSPDDIVASLSAEELKISGNTTTTGTHTIENNQIVDGDIAFQTLVTAKRTTNNTSYDVFKETIELVDSTEPTQEAAYERFLVNNGTLHSVEKRNVAQHYITNPSAIAATGQHFTTYYTGLTNNQAEVVGSLSVGREAGIPYWRINPGFDDSQSVVITSGTVNIGAGTETGYTFPLARGSENQVLTAGTAGTITWETPEALTPQSEPDNPIKTLSVSYPMDFNYSAANDDFEVDLPNQFWGFHNSSIGVQGDKNTSTQYRTSPTDISSGSTVLNPFKVSETNNIIQSILSNNSLLAPGADDTWGEDVDPMLMVGYVYSTGTNAGPKFDLFRHTGSINNQRTGHIHFTAKHTSGDKGSIAAIRTYATNINTIGDDVDTAAGRLGILVRGTNAVLSEAYLMDAVGGVNGRIKHTIKDGVNTTAMMTIENDADAGTTVSINSLRSCSTTGVSVGDLCITDETVDGQGSNTGIFRLGIKQT